MKRVIMILVPLILIAVLIRLFIFKPEFTYAGTVEATRVDLSARVASDIATADVKEGDRVQKDQILMTLGCEDIRIASRLANQSYTRALRLLQSGSLPKESFDLAENKKQDVDLKLSWCTIKSPLSGTVLNRYHEPGELVSPGTKLLSLARLDEVWAYIYVPQPLIHKLSLGQKLTGALPEEKTRTIMGVITQISDQAEFTPRNVQTREERTRLVYAVKLLFDNGDGFLKPGMSVEMKIPE